MTCEYSEALPAIYPIVHVFSMDFAVKAYNASISTVCGEMNFWDLPHNNNSMTSYMVQTVPTFNGFVDNNFDIHNIPGIETYDAFSKY